MDNRMMTSMMVVLMFKTVAEALRNPEKFSAEVRNQMAETLEDIAKTGKDHLLTDLMNEELDKKTP